MSAPLRPVVVVGAARSGTKIMRDALTTALAVGHVPYDVSYVWRHGNESVPHDVLQPSDVKPRTRRLVRRFLSRYASADGWVVEKTVGNTLRVRFVAEILPEAMFVELVRDGVDVADSARREWLKTSDLRYLLRKARHFPIRLVPTYGVKVVRGLVRHRVHGGHAPTWGPRYPGIDDDLAAHGLLTVVARQWRHSVQDASQDLSAVTAQVVRVRYEELVADPRETLRRVVRELGRSIDETRLEAAAGMVRPGCCSPARTRLTDAERALLSDEIGEVLEHGGYASP